MMPSDRFDRQLPSLLDELAAPRTPDYFDSLLGQTARTRQRPAWMILERWLPMVDVARRPVIVPRLPLRTVGLGLLLVGLILAIVAAIVVGSRHNLPAPFGPAHNGLVAYSANGDIFVVDPVSGQPKAVATGPELDLNPVWSRDGTRIAFERKVATETGPGSIHMIGADGSRLTRVTPEPLSEIGAVSFSPDGRRLLLHATVDSAQSILVAAVDGSGVRKLDVGRLAVAVGWRPPLGDEILFTDAPISNDEIGYYAIHPDGGPVRTILPYAPGQGRGGQIWSPDGTRIAYFDYESDLTTVRTHIINADGTGDRVLALPSEAAWEAPVAWSNDGTRLLSIRGFDDGYSTSRAVARPVDGTDTGIEIDAPGALQQGCCISAEWAPDDTSILVAPTNAARESIEQVMLDVKTGTTSGVPWSTTSIPTWQRRAD